MYRWTSLWETCVDVGPIPVASATTPVLAVDPRAGAPAVSARRIEPGPSVRYLAVDRLGQALREILTRLRRGEEPGSLGLGEDVRQPGCERLLTLLYIQWCGSGIGQFGAQRERGEDARAAVGFAGVCRQLGLESEAFRTGAVAIRAAAGPFTEQWYVAATGAPGFIAVARGPECDERLRHHQLVALRRRSATHFQLAVVQWMKLEEDGDLSIGLRLLPGVPTVTRVEPDDAKPGDEHVLKAILLPAAPEMRAPATLVLPPNAFRPGRELVLRSGTLQRVQLTRLVERGTDFERAAFELIA